MKRYSVRPAVPHDLEGVYALIEKQNISDYGDAMMTIEDLRRSWQNMNIERDTCAAHSDGKLAGYAELLQGDSASIYLADRNNIDLAFQLLTILEEIAVSRKGNKVRLTTRISEKNQTLLQLFASNGFRSHQSFFVMELALDEPPPAPRTPLGISVRTFQKNRDEQATYRADEEAAQNIEYHNPLGYDAWIKLVGMEKETFDSNLWYLAWDGNEVAGIALNEYHEDSHVGWVDHLGVRTAWSDRGVGRALLLYSFGEFYRRGARRTKLSVDSKSLAHAPYRYASVGLKSVQQYHIYTKELH